VTTTGATCEALRRDGEPCRSWTVSGSRFCLAHDPARAAQIAEARRRGGKARHGRRIGTTGEVVHVELAGPGDVLKLLERAVNDALEAENSLSRARVVGYLGSVYAEIWKTTELERRLSVLEVRMTRGDI
jgi:hypothetical protein